ncbi:MAG: sigma-70 family RNA polymerase sigma factor [Actinomycetota bacterium]
MPARDDDVVAAASFDAVFHAEYRGLVALAAATSGDRVRAEDIVQEAMARLDREWASVSAYERPGAWLRRVTINLALSQRRRLVREASALLRLDRREPSFDPAPPAEHRHLWELVGRLPGKQRAVIALHYLDDASIDEIADVLDIAPSTARVHLHRARQTLRDRLEEVDR